MAQWRTTSIPVGARIDAEVRGTVHLPGKALHGTRILARRCSGFYSHTVQKGYEPTTWIAWRVAGSHSECLRFTGRRLLKAESIWTEVLSQIMVEGPSNG